jgi:Protein of unknown function, DUF488
VRLTPVSRKPGLSKLRLADALAAVGIEYLHLPALGNPLDNRDAFRQGDPRSQARFQGLLGTPHAQSALAELGARAQEKRVALLCFERDADCTILAMSGGACRASRSGPRAATTSNASLQGKAPGRWHGRGAAAIGLAGELCRELYMAATRSVTRRPVISSGGVLSST